jgi:Uncharacterized protein conserved in bacteria
MKIISIQTGLPQTLRYGARDVTTGIFKSPAVTPIMVRTLNLEGDGQADLCVHGGADKAIYAYSLDAYPDWQNLRPNEKFENGAFGENLCIDEIAENQIYVGDTFEVGQAILQAAQPRFPCYKLGVKFNDIKVVKQFMEMNRPGVYFRVIKEGMIDIGDELKLVSQEKVLVSILELFELHDERFPDPERVREILKVKSLSQNWKEMLKEFKA